MKNRQRKQKSMMLSFIIHLLSSPSTVVKYMCHVLFKDKIHTSNNMKNNNFVKPVSDILAKQRKGGFPLLVLLLGGSS